MSRVIADGLSVKAQADLNLSDELFTNALKNKLDAIEANATTDQTNSEIKSAYEANADTNAFTDAEETKLSNIESSATNNDTNAQLRARSSHTGTQSVSTITGLADAATTSVSSIQSGTTKSDVGLSSVDNYSRAHYDARFDAAGDADTAVNDHVALADPHTQYAELSGGASANFTAMPQVGGDPVVESGSNSDGEWTRWSDGTQICKTESPLNQTDTSGRFEMNYPTPFSNATSNFRVVAGSENQGSTFARRYNVNSVLVDSTSILIAYLGVSSIAYPVRYMIIGRWK